jgi:pyrroloquinoline quinone (PQQ) biosynthesis protein C
VRAEITKWVRDLNLEEKDLEVLTANDNADEDHSDMMEGIFLKYATTPETKTMLLQGAKDSLDMFRTFHDTLNHAISRIQ